MKFDVITLFPDLIEDYASCSIIGRARKNNVITVNTINPRDFTHDKHRTVDDTPYGGGAGMVLMCDPIFSAIESVQKLENSCTILLTPQGKPYNQEIAHEFSQKDQLLLICGHYEGFDERIRQGLDLVEISIGDFVLTGGELAALCIVDSVTRLLPGALGKVESAFDDTFSSGLLEYPQYTRPPEYRGMTVPEVLLSGNHKEIDKWRRKQAIIRTMEKRPDLFEKFVQKGISKEDKLIIDEYILEQQRN
ncbi:MAG: tRNA (guanosine(37)-N1)-methyltransferase TrmD [Candidatus Melainabacteria bacterium GWF2_32_7]|nr:MAG: tRNA (guanosine(37)-N1)-methyltransferase TrmD [Candidatus Melainabacteria bacterium GWF2_32_7]